MGNKLTGSPEAADEKVFGDVGEYRVQFHPVLATGGFGIIHSARCKTTNKEVVAKTINLDKGDLVKMKEMVSKELTILSTLQSHKNIVKLFSHVMKNNAIFIFLEFCDKGDLGKYLKDNPSLPLRNRILIIDEMISAICYMHGQNPSCVHRDLKPQNILLKQEGSRDVVKVTDFGLSKIYENSESLSAVFNPRNALKTTCGTPHFMAPEFYAELKGGTTYNEAVDTFALGLIMKVVIEYSPTHRELNPRSVQARKSQVDVAYGEELVSKFKSKEPMPRLFEDGQTGDCTTLKLQRIISQMTERRPTNRKAMKHAKEEISEIIEDFQQEQHQRGEAGRKSTGGEIMDSNEVRLQMSQRAEGARLELLSLTSSCYQEKRSVRVQGWPCSLFVAHERLYSCEGNTGLAMYSLALEKICYLIQGYHLCGGINGGTGVSQDAIAVAGSKGLFIVSKTGVVLQQLSGTEHRDVCLGSDGRIYAVGWSNGLWQVHVYERQRGDWVKTQQFDCPCTSKQCIIKITQGNKDVYFSCGTHNILQTFNQKEWRDVVLKSRDKAVTISRASVADDKGNVLVVDTNNSRLEVMSADGRCTELRTETRFERPISAVISGRTLYVGYGDYFLREFRLK